MTTEKKFANGILFKRNENAPDFVIGKLSFKVDEAVKFLEENSENGWVNLNINKSQNGKFYIELDEWKPTQKSVSTQMPTEQVKLINTGIESSLPF